MNESVAIIHLLTWRTCLRIFMHYARVLIQLPCCLRHFRKGMYHGGDRQLCTYISYVLLSIDYQYVRRNNGGVAERDVNASSNSR